MFDTPDFNLHIFDELGSTSDYLLEQSNSHALPSGYAVQALKQTAGRGRYQRVWEDKGGNIALSFLIKPKDMEQRIGQLSLTVAISAFETMLGSGIPKSKIRLKWPNDIFLNEKKCCGFLIEKSDQGYVVGIGINITAAPEDRSYLNELSNDNIMIADFIEDFFKAFKKHYISVQQGNFDQIKSIWMDHAKLKGRKIRVKLKQQEFDAIAKELDQNGALIVERADTGEERLITSAEIFD